MSNTNLKYSKRRKKSLATPETEQKKERKIYLETGSFTYNILLRKYICFYANLCAKQLTGSAKEIEQQVKQHEA